MATSICNTKVGINPMQTNEQAPLLPQHGKPLQYQTSLPKAFFLLLTSLIGSGMLFLPQAFRNAGLFFSAIIIVFSGFASLFTLNQLVSCQLQIYKSDGRINIGYGGLARRAYGTRMESVVNASIIMLYLGYSCVGSVFVATTLRDSFNDLTGCRWHTLSLGFWIAVQGIVLIPLCLIRHMRGFSRVSLVANVFVFVGLTYVLSISSRMLMQRGYGPNVKHFNSANVPLFLGSAVYTYSNHGFVLPVVAAMRQPEKMPRLLVLAISTCVLLSLTVGGISYAAFGDTTQQIILINMPPEAIATQVIRVIYAMAVAGAIPMTMYPVYKALELLYFSIASGKHNSYVKFGKNMFRITLLVSVLAVAAMGADRLDLFVSVIGGVACVPLGFVYPPLIHLRLATKINQRWQRVRDITLAVVGVILSVYVTTSAIRRWSIIDIPIDRCISP